MKRILYILLFVLLLIPAITACGNNGGGENTNADSNGNISGESTPAAESGGYPVPDIPAHDFGGAEFNLLCNDPLPERQAAY